MMMAIALMMEAARISEMSVDSYFTRQYIPEDKSELHTRRRENLKSHNFIFVSLKKKGGDKAYPRVPPEKIPGYNYRICHIVSLSLLPERETSLNVLQPSNV
jgi:hypothetical protein